MERWVLVAELRGALVRSAPWASTPVAAVIDGRVVDLDAAAARAGVREGMAERTATLRVPNLRRLDADAATRERACRAVREGLAILSDGVRDDGLRGAVLPFLPFAVEALALPWASACARLVPAHGWCLEGAAGPSAWAARALLRAGRAGERAVRRFELAGGLLYAGDWRDLGVDVLEGVPASQLERLRRLGVRTLGGLVRLPRERRRDLVGASWARRLGGEADDADDADDPNPDGGGGGRCAVVRRFEPPLCEAAALEGAAAVAAATAAERLQRRGEGVRRLTLVLTDEAGGDRRLEREFLLPLPPHRLGGAVRSLLWTRAAAAAVAALRLETEGVPAPWSQSRLTGARLEASSLRPVGATMAGWRRDRRLRREARLRLWDPLRGALRGGGMGDAEAR
jgi:hypothetical protein